MSIVKTDDKHYSNIAKAIRDKTGDDTKYTPEDMVSGVGEVYEAGIEQGKDDEHRSFWNSYQGGGGQLNYTDAFSNYRWNDACYNPRYTIVGGNLSGAFRSTFITDTKVKIKHNGTESANVFRLSKLKTIRLLEVVEITTFSNWFLDCTALENITFEGVIANAISFAQSNLLTTESVQSIIDHLKDLTGQTAKKVQFHTDVLLQMSDEQYAAIWAKNWTT